MARDYRQFLNEIYKTSILTREEEAVLFKRFREGEESAKKEIVKANLRLVAFIAQKFRGRGVPLEDLIQEGCLGLLKAVERFDATRGFKFSTYASQWIRQAMRKAIDDQKEVIRFPAHIASKVRQVRKFENPAQFEKLTEEEQAQKLGVSVKRLRKVLLAKETEVVSQVHLEDDGEYKTLVENLPSNGLTPFDALLQAEFVWHRNEIEKILTEREREVLRLRIDYERKLHEIGRLYNLSGERVRQLERKAIEKLRAYVEGREVVKKRGRKRKAG